MIDFETQRKESQTFQANQAEQSRRHNNRSLAVALLGPVIALIATFVNVINANKTPAPITIQLQQPPSSAAPTTLPHFYLDTPSK